MRGMLTLSDDSHGVAQLGLNFERTIRYLEGLGVESIHYLEREAHTSKEESGSQLIIISVSLGEIKVEGYPAT